MRYSILFIFQFIFILNFYGQLVINEGCNKNYTSLLDENGDTEDWIEILNASANAINLLNYSLSDKPTQPEMWSFPDFILNPGDREIVFCSSKNRFLGGSFDFCLSQQNFNPIVGWNTHYFSTPFQWDGNSNIILNVCSYNNSGYTENSIFYQSDTPFPSTLVSFIDGSPAACSSNSGQIYSRRPNIRINGQQIGFGVTMNSNTDYPAPYGNWYWGARHQILYRAQELIMAGDQYFTLLFNSQSFKFPK